VPGSAVECESFSRGKTGTFSGRLNASLLQELQELHRRAIAYDKGHEHAFRWAVRFDEDLVPGEGGLQIINLEGNVRNPLHELRERAVRFVSHPLDAAGVALVIGAEELVVFEVCLARPRRISRDSNVMVLPQFAPGLSCMRRCGACRSIWRPTLRTFRRDLERTEIPYHTERGEVDRKSLRKTFGTHLAMAGVDLRVAVKLMRHSDPRLTMNVYTDPMLLDMKGAVEVLDAKLKKCRGGGGKS